MNDFFNESRKPDALLYATCSLFLLVWLLFSSSALGETGNYEGDTNSPNAQQLSREELEELVAPVALYPDDLLGIVLPASTYPLQVVQAARYLNAREDDKNLQPDEAWDDSIIALLNYPEALDLLNSDLDWSWKLGEAVLSQQNEVITAIGDFRERARVAGNLKNDKYQTVEVLEDGAIEIKPADPEVIYVPYYEPSKVIVYSPWPVYHYYSHAYPVYYYPYPLEYSFSSFHSGFFWGVTSMFSIGWGTHQLHVHHYGYDGHPYHNRQYYDDHYFYRRPIVSISYYQNFNYHYDRRSEHKSDYRSDHKSDHKSKRNRNSRRDTHHAGNYWRPTHNRSGARPWDRYRSKRQTAHSDSNRPDNDRHERLTKPENKKNRERNYRQDTKAIQALARPIAQDTNQKNILPKLRSMRAQTRARPTNAGPTSAERQRLATFETDVQREKFKTTRPKRRVEVQRSSPQQTRPQQSRPQQTRASQPQHRREEQPAATQPQHRRVERPAATQKPPEPYVEQQPALASLPKTVPVQAKKSSHKSADRSDRKTKRSFR